MIFVGIDPGLTGAVAAVDSAGTCAVEDLPTVQLPGSGLVRRRVDGLALAKMLRHMVPIGHACLVVIEDVIALGGKNNAVQTQGSIMRSVGTIEAAVEILRMPIKRAQPRTWKKFYGLGAEKGASLAIARELYPLAPLGLAKHHNRAEALLLAHYGQARLA